MQRYLLIACLSLVSLAGCESKTAEEHLAEAETAIANGDRREAIIHVRNALQQNGDFLEARVRLGELMLWQGDYPGALAEFERAANRGDQSDAARLGFLRAKLGLGEYQQVIGELSDEDSLAPPYAVLLGDAYLQARDLPRAQLLYEQGADLAAGAYGLGLIAAVNGDRAVAKAQFSKAHELDPEHAPALLQLAEQMLHERSFAEAREYLFKAKPIPTGNISARVGIVRSYILEGNLEAANREIDQALKVAAQLPVIQYLKGLVSFQRGNLEAAETALREVQTKVPGHLPSLYLMGAVKYAQRQYGQAIDNLNRFLREDPNNDSARKLLASLLSEQGDFEGVVDLLRTRGPSSADPQLLALLGTAYLRTGQHGNATSVFERAVELAPDMAVFRNHLALSLMSAGEVGRAETELKFALDQDSDQFQSDYLIAMLRLRERDVEGAFQAANQIVTKEPDAPIGHHLVGTTHLIGGNTSAAREAFQQALELDPSYYPAAASLASMASEQQDLASTKAVWQDFLAASPDNEAGLLNLAQLELKAGKSEEALALLKLAVTKHPNALRPRLGLVRMLVAAADLEQADRELDSALRVHSEHPDLLLLRGDLHLRMGNEPGAQATAERLQKLASGHLSDNVRFALALGDLQGRLGNLALSREHYERAVEQSAGFLLPAELGMARVALADGDLDGVRSILKRIEGAGVDDTQAVALLKGDLLVAEGKTQDAEAVYQALANDGYREGMMRYVTTLLHEGRTSVAIDKIGEWLAERPGDAGMKGLLAMAHLQKNDQAAALSVYESLMPTEDAVVLNNLAWLYFEKGDDRALRIARQAYDNAPSNPEIGDTLGWILLERGEVGEGAEILKESARLRPDNGSVQYHLAVAYAKQGRTTQAVRVLQTALELGRFPERDEARKLLAELQG